MPNSTALRNTRMASALSAGAPHIPSPVRRIDPNPSRVTRKSPPSKNWPALAASPLPFSDADFFFAIIPSSDFSFRCSVSIGVDFRSELFVAFALPTQAAVTLNQRIGRAVMLQFWFRSALQLRHNPLRQGFSQLHSPLIERVDAPDRTLREYAVFVKRNQRAQSSRRQLLRQDHVRRAIAFKYPERNLKIGYAFGLYLFRSLSKSQRFRLRKNIRHQ